MNTGDRAIAAEFNVLGSGAYSGRDAAQRLGSNSSSCRMECVAMRDRISRNHSNGSMFTSSHEETKLLRMAMVLPPRSLPRNVQLFRPTATPRSDLSV